MQQPRLFSKYTALLISIKPDALEITVFFSDSRGALCYLKERVYPVKTPQPAAA